jgi:hypothetical protein
MIVLHLFTEEESAKKVFDIILPKLFPGLDFRVYKHQGKQDLENALRKTLPVLCKSPDNRILITRDQNSSDCRLVKQRLKDLIKLNCVSSVMIRIICRELESWFLGDFDALKLTFPRFNPDYYVNKRAFKKVDLLHNPDQHLLKIIPELKGKKYFPKIEMAEKLAPLLNPENNNSESFTNTISGLRKLVENLYS